MKSGERPSLPHLAASRHRVARKLAVQPSVDAAVREERVVVAAFNDAAPFQDEHEIGVADRGKPMRHHEACSPCQ